jgi:hypothetical protein
MPTNGLRFGKYPTDEIILGRLRELNAQGVAMCYKHIKTADCALWGAIDRYYPSLKDAVEQAGLHYIKVPSGHRLNGEGCKPWTDIKTPERCPDYAYFIGVLIGDGCIHPSTVKCDAHDAEMVTNFAEIGYQLFGIEPKWSREMRRGPHRAEHGDAFYRVCFHSHKLVELMRSEVGKPIKRIPEWIKNGSPETMSAFIRGFADAEGCANKKRNTFRVSMAQKDRDILEDIKVMLTSMNIVSSVTTCNNCSNQIGRAHV